MQLKAIWVLKLKSSLSCVNQNDNIKSFPKQIKSCSKSKSNGSSHANWSRKQGGLNLPLGFLIRLLNVINPFFSRSIQRLTTPLFRFLRLFFFLFPKLFWLIKLCLKFKLTNDEQSCSVKSKLTSSVSPLVLLEFLVLLVSWVLLVYSISSFSFPRIPHHQSLPHRDPETNHVLQFQHIKHEWLSIYTNVSE